MTLALSLQSISSYVIEIPQWCSILLKANAYAYIRMER